MKPLHLFLIIACLALAACRKAKDPLVDYGVYTLRDVDILNDGFKVVSLPLDIKYDHVTDRSEVVTLSVSGLPEGITMDESWVHEGKVPYSTAIIFYDTTAARAFPGSYRVTLTAVSSLSGSRVLTFKVNVIRPPICTEYLEGKYSYCHSYRTGKDYADSVYTDPRILNRLWFTNFDNTGEQLYADMDCNTQYLQIPAQTIKGVTYSGGYVCKNEKEMSLIVRANAREYVITMH